MGGERHGGWIWTVSKQGDKLLTRSVSFAVTDEASPGPTTPYVVEVEAGASSGRAYHRLPVRTFRYIGAEPLTRAVETEVREAFVEALERAELLHPTDLTSRYLPGAVPPRQVYRQSENLLA